VFRILLLFQLVQLGQCHQSDLFHQSDLLGQSALFHLCFRVVQLLRLNLLHQSRQLLLLDLWDLSGLLLL
jgi:hypothetical protein